MRPFVNLRNRPRRGRRIAIYTAIFGGYDDLKAPVEQDVDCDFFCFSDTKFASHVGSWRPIWVPTDPDLHPRLQAKRFRIMSHEVFPRGKLALKYAAKTGLLFGFKQYDATIWCDGNFKIKSATFARAVSELVTEKEIAVFVHPDRNCIYEEAAASLPMLKYQKLPILSQVEHYRQLGISARGGLYASGVVGRKARESAEVRAFNQIWWAENCSWTYQDQLSLPYALRESGVSVRPIPSHLWTNPWGDWLPHRSEY